jgi:hypothetical protein
MLFSFAGPLPCIMTADKFPTFMVFYFYYSLFLFIGLNYCILLCRGLPPHLFTQYFILFIFIFIHFYLFLIIRLYYCILLWRSPPLHYDGIDIPRISYLVIIIHYVILPCRTPPLHNDGGDIPHQCAGGGGGGQQRRQLGSQLPRVGHISAPTGPRLRAVSASTNQHKYIKYNKKKILTRIRNRNTA